MFGARPGQRRRAYLNPCLDSSEEEDEISENESSVKPHKRKGIDEDESDDSDVSSGEEVESGDDLNTVKNSNRFRPVRSRRNVGYEDDFFEETLNEGTSNPQGSSGEEMDSDNSEEDEKEEESDEDSAASDEMSEDNVSDSDFMPDSEDEREAETNVTINETINLSSDASPCETPEGKSERKENLQTFDPNSKEFWNKVGDLRNKGLSLQPNKQPMEVDDKVEVAPKSPLDHNMDNIVRQQSKLVAFTQLYIKFEHEKQCRRKCFMIKEEQRQELAEIKDPRFVSPDLVKACIRVVMCCIRLGETNTAREAIRLFLRLGEVPNISALCQAMIAGVRSQHQALDEIDRLEKSGLEALRSKEFSKAADCLGKAVRLASCCPRLQMARGDCLAFLGLWDEGAKVASCILEVEEGNVGALYLKGFCLYRKNSMDQAITQFKQALQLSTDHDRAKDFLGKAKQVKEKKDQAGKAARGSRHADAVRIYTEAIDVDLRNKDTVASLQTDRAEIYFKMKKIPECATDCEAALKLNMGCLRALLLRAKCYMETKEWGPAVGCYERLNNLDRDRQQAKKKAGEAAMKSLNYDEAYRLYSEALEVDRHNKGYRAQLREAKQQHYLASRVNYYQVLGVEKTSGDSEIKKAYFRKSKEYHPDRHANAPEDQKEDYSNKFKLAKEAYEVLSDTDKRKSYDSGFGGVKPPPGGWYRDMDRKILQTVYPSGVGRGGGVARGRGGAVVRGNINIRPSAPVRGQATRGGVTLRGGARPGLDIRFANNGNARQNGRRGGRARQR